MTQDQSQGTTVRSLQDMFEILSFDLLFLCIIQYDYSSILALRYEVAVDLLRTERHYCSCLWNLIEYVYEPLRDSHLLPEKEFKYVMFIDNFVL